MTGALRNLDVCLEEGRLRNDTVTFQNVERAMNLQMNWSRWHQEVPASEARDRRELQGAWSPCDEDPSQGQNRRDEMGHAEAHAPGGGRARGEVQGTATPTVRMFLTPREAGSTDFSCGRSALVY